MSLPRIAVDAMGGDEGLSVMLEGVARARRRFDELVARGAAPVLEDVVRNLRERDYIDSHRETSPLCKAEDAFELDNSAMGLSEELAWVEGLVRGKFNLL